MSSSRGHYKGGEFEREIAVALSLWLTEDASPNAVVRTVTSGAQYTNSTIKGKTKGIPGDLMSSYENHPACQQFFDHFVVECKWWKDIELYRLLFPRPSSKADNHDLMYALSKVRAEAEQTKKDHWMLVARQNMGRTIAFMSPSTWHSDLLVKASITPHYFFDELLMVFDFYLMLEKVKSKAWNDPYSTLYKSSLD